MEVATPAHAAALAAIHAAAFPPGARWGADAMALQLALPGVFGLVAAEGGFVLARAVADEAEVLTLGVMPGARRRGLGRALLAGAMARAARAGARAMLLEVAEDNAAAMALYCALGFAAAGRRPDYYGQGRAALILRAELGSSA